jgi:ABC-2 type transport system permease protein
MNHPFLQLCLARLREFYREPEVIFWVYGFPLLLAVGLGIAFANRKPDPQPVDVQRVAGQDDAELAKVLNTAGLKVEVHDEVECEQRLRTGKTVLYVVPSTDGYRYIYDETLQESQIARPRVDDAIVRWKLGKTIPWNTVDEHVTEPGNRYIDFLLPGLIGANLMGGGLFGVGFVLVDMRVRKLLKRLLATPMRRSHFLLAVLVGRLVLMLPEMLLLLLLGWLAFDVPVRGSLLTVSLFILVGAAAFAGIGLLVASRSEKTETVSGLINLVMIPSWVLSGVFFSSKRFPEMTQPIIQALPLTQLNDALREVMLEGATFTQVAWRFAILAAWAVVTFVVALRIFRWQ